MDGWELVEQRSDGLWYTIERKWGAVGHNQLTQWVSMNGGRRIIRVRGVNHADPYLQAAKYPDGHTDVVEDGEQDTMAARTDDAKNEGFALANALFMVFQPVGRLESNALFTLGWKFSKFAGYVDTDGSMAYIQGFLAGAQSNSQKILDAPTNGSATQE